MTTQPPSQCSTCAHFRQPFDRARTQRPPWPTCAAFPAAIPKQVFGNLLDHRQPIDGDHGVRWAGAVDDKGRRVQAFPEWAFHPENLGKGR